MSSMSTITHQPAAPSKRADTLQPAPRSYAVGTPSQSTTPMQPQGGPPVSFPNGRPPGAPAS